MEKVLPRVEDKDGHEKLQRGHEDMVDDFGERHLPAGKHGNSSAARAAAAALGLEKRVVTARDRAGEQGMCLGHVLRNGRGVEPDEPEQAGDGALGQSQARRPDGNVVLVLADVLGRVGELEDGTGGDLDDLLDDDVAGDLVARGVVAAGDFLRGVQSVLGEEVEGVDEVKGERHGPVDEDGKEEGEPKVGAPGDEVGSGLEVIGGQRRQGRVEKSVVVGHDGREGPCRCVDHFRAGWTRGGWLCITLLGCILQLSLVLGVCA